MGESECTRFSDDPLKRRSDSEMPVRIELVVEVRSIRNDLFGYVPPERGRSPLHIARSTDNGKTWSQPAMLESNPGEYSYPSIMQTPEGKIHVIYTYRRYSFKHVEFSEDWLTRIERPD